VVVVPLIEIESGLTPGLVPVKTLRSAAVGPPTWVFWAPLMIVRSAALPPPEVPLARNPNQLPRILTLLAPSTRMPRAGSSCSVSIEVRCDQSLIASPLMVLLPPPAPTSNAYVPSIPGPVPRRSSIRGEPVNPG
jgi:hypothetical protein